MRNIIIWLDEITWLEIIRTLIYFTSLQHSMTHDNTGPVISKFLSLSCKSFSSTTQPVFTLDHDVQNHSPTNLTKYKKIEAFAKQHGIDFYPAGRGIGHQIMVEEGYAWPGKMVVASDSHSNHYGGVGCLGTAIVRWVCGRSSSDFDNMGMLILTSIFSSCTGQTQREWRIPIPFVKCHMATIRLLNLSHSSAFPLQRNLGYREILVADPQNRQSRTQKYPSSRCHR